MAYRDRNGKITIDEYAANQDIKRLSEAVQVLKDSRNAIQNLQRQAEDLRGETAVAIQTKGQEMYRKLTRMIDKLEETIAFIRKTVRYYEEMDAEIKRAIQAAADASAAAAAAAAVTASSSGFSGGGGGGGTSGGGGASRGFGSSSSGKSSSGSSKKTNTSSKNSNKSNGLSDFFDGIGDLLDDIF